MGHYGRDVFFKHYKAFPNDWSLGALENAQAPAYRANGNYAAAEKISDATRPRPPRLAS
jgi:hypothetical protein